MNLLRRIYLEIRHNSIVTFILISLASWLVEQIANYSTGQTTIQFWSRQNLIRLIILLVGTLLIVLVMRGGVWLWNRIRSSTLSLGTPPPQRRGLILIFGRESTARKAVEHHRDTLDFVWFILTEQTKIEFEKLPGNWWGKAVAVQEFLLNPYRPEEIGKIIENIVNHAESLRLEPEDLICDVTGGTTAMTIGAFAACIRKDVQVQMVPALYDQELKAIQALSPIIVDAKTRRTPKRRNVPET